MQYLKQQKVKNYVLELYGLAKDGEIKILEQYVVLSAKLHHLHILLQVQPIFLIDILQF